MKIGAIYGPCAKKAFQIVFSTAPAVTRTVTWNGGQWVEYQVTKSCQMVVDGEVLAHVWACGGGAGGGYGGYGQGGGGAYATLAARSLSSGTYSVVVGAGGPAATSSFVASMVVGSASSIGSTAANGGSTYGNGGSGGGSSSLSASATNCQGDGQSKYPFGDTSNFSNRSHCGGGGAGVHVYYSPASGGTSTNTSRTQVGGVGGSNGKNGNLATTYSLTTSGTGAAGGSYGGGKGGNATYESASVGGNATYYGSGGGGGSTCYKAREDVSISAKGGAGYQGIVYIRVPA